MLNKVRDNGRYLGNLLALLITRSKLAKTVVIAIGFIWILRVIEKCICDKNTVVLRSAILLLFSLPQTIYAQSYGWPAAFVNFVPDIILFIVYGIDCFLTGYF